MAFSVFITFYCTFYGLECYFYSSVCSVIDTSIWTQIISPPLDLRKPGKTQIADPAKYLNVCFPFVAFQRIPPKHTVTSPGQSWCWPWRWAAWPCRCCTSTRCLLLTLLPVLWGPWQRTSSVLQARDISPPLLSSSPAQYSTRPAPTTISGEPSLIYEKLTQHDLYSFFSYCYLHLISAQSLHQYW